MEGIWAQTPTQCEAANDRLSPRCFEDEKKEHETVEDQAMLGYDEQVQEDTLPLSALSPPSTRSERHTAKAGRSDVHEMEVGFGVGEDTGLSHSDNGTANGTDVHTTGSPSTPSSAPQHNAASTLPSETSITSRRTRNSWLQDMDVEQQEEKELQPARSRGERATRGTVISGDSCQRRQAKPSGRERTRGTTGRARPTSTSYPHLPLHQQQSVSA